MPIIGGMVDPNRVMEKVPRYDSWQSNRHDASNYTLSGPTTGSNGVATAPFSVTVPAGLRLTKPMVVTPAASGGTFTPSTVRLTDNDRTATFTYTLVGTGSKTISVTNDAGLTDPTSIVCVIS